MCVCVYKPEAALVACAGRRLLYMYTGYALLRSARTKARAIERRRATQHRGAKKGAMQCRRKVEDHSMDILATTIHCLRNRETKNRARPKKKKTDKILVILSSSNPHSPSEPRRCTILSRGLLRTTATSDELTIRHRRR